MAKLNTMTMHLAPKAADALAGKQMCRQNYDEPPRDRNGALYEASEKGAGPSGKIRGLGPSG